MMVKIYYNQADSRWADKLYTSTNNSSQTLKSSGCGPTSSAMIVSSLKETVYPNVMADLFVANGLRSAKNGTFLKAFEWIGQKWNINVNLKYKLDDAIECLKRGGMVIANCKANGLFSTGDHIIVLAGIKDENTIIVYDPYLYSGKFNLYNRPGKVVIDGNNAYVSYENFKNYGLYTNLYCYEPTNIEVTPVTPVITNTVGQNKVFNKNTTIYQNSNLSGTKYSYLANTTVQILENVSPTIDKVKASVTARDGYVDNRDLYKNTVSTTSNTNGNGNIGQIKTFKNNTTIYSNSNLTGTKYSYLPNTTVVVLENLGTVDKIKVRQTGRIGYVSKNVYK